MSISDPGLTSLLKTLETNEVRPFTVPTTEHNDNIATLVLYNQKNLTPSGINTSTNYLTNFNSPVKSLSPEIVSSSATNSPVKANGVIPVIDMNQNQDYYGVFNNFSVTSMTESRGQISKIHMNFSARWNVFFFGNTPRIYQVRGYFIDTQEYPYYHEFIIAYEKYLGGRQCVENGIQLKMFLAGQMINGFMLDINVTHNAQMPMLKDFMFSYLVVDTSWVRINITHKGGIETGYNTTPVTVVNGLSNLSRLTSNEANQLQGLV